MKSDRQSYNIEGIGQKILFKSGSSGIHDPCLEIISEFCDTKSKDQAHGLPVSGM
jgi:hypothetical protein